MKTIIKIFILFFALSCGYSCKAQLMQTLGNANKIEANKDYYVGKKFKTILIDIKPKIEFYAILPDPSYTKVGGIALLFDIPARHFNRLSNAKNKDEAPATIGVYFADIEAVNKIIKNRRGPWTKGLADSLSNLIIQRVYAYGKN